MSKEYIEKEAAIDYLTLNMNWYDEDGGQVDDWDERKAIISDLLDGIPPADVKPVVKGEWILVMEGMHSKTYRCTNCGNYFVEHSNTLNAGRGDKKFCPTCGAEMQEEVNNDA